MNNPIPQSFSDEPQPDDRIELSEPPGAMPEGAYASFLYTGPIPPPKALDQYDQVLPGAADRIMSMAEREQAHRQKMEEKLVDAQVLDMKRSRDERRLGQIFGLTIGVVTVVSGSVTAILGAPIAGAFIGLSGVTGLVSVFVLGRRDQDEKDPLTQQLPAADDD